LDPPLVVLDTQIVVAGTIGNREGASARVLDAVATGDVHLAISDDQLKELVTVMGYADVEEALDRPVRAFEVALVRPQRRLCVMSYSGLHETSNLCTFAFGKGAREPRGGAALQRFLRDAPMPDTFGKLSRTIPSKDRPEFGMRLADGQERHPRLQRSRPSRPHAWILAPQVRPCRFRRRERRGSQRDAPPLAEGVWIRQHESVDFGDGRRSRFRGGTHTKASLRGDHPGDSGAPPRSSMDASQAVDHLPRPPLRKKKRRRDRLMSVAAADPEWAVGFLDECWWSRVALPTLSSWSEEGKPLRLLQKSLAKDDPEPKAISCYGLYLPELDQTWLRFVDGRPVSGITTQFLEWSCEKLEAAAKKVLLLIWDNASWHISREVRRWLGRHNREVKESGRGVRIVSCLLPKQSPWLNAIEPKWVHGKRKVVESDRLLGAYELADRVCRVFGCPHYEHLSVPQKVA
jgi:hypothetical protein